MNNWEETPISFESNILPHEIFGFFLTGEEIEIISLKSTSYARLKGEHNVTITLDKLKAFIAILLVSRYTEPPKQEMCWERREDGHKLLLSSMMSKNKFEEYQTYLHLIDNNNLDLSDWSGEVPPLLNSIN